MGEKMMTCAQCSRPFWAKRSTAKYCGAACRKAANRGVTPRPYWRDWAGKDTLEELVAQVAQESPEIWAKLEDIRAKWGPRAVRAALQVLEMGIAEYSEDPDRKRPRRPKTGPK